MNATIQQAVQQHVGSADHAEIQSNLRAAIENAATNGDPGLAAQFAGLLSKQGSNPAGLKAEVISLITDDPGILQHFDPSFANAVLSKL